MKIYITRHGQTDWNAQNRVLGRTDLPLNDLGREQAAMAAENLKDISFDAIYASPYQRALETAQIIGSKQNCDVIVADALREQNFGVFEGYPRDDEEYQKEKHMYFKPFEDGESFLDVAARVYPFIEELKARHQADDTILLVSHGGICRIIHNFFDGMDNDQFASYFLENCQTEVFDTNKEQK